MEIKKDIETLIECYLDECSENKLSHAAVQMAQCEFTIESDDYSIAIYGELSYTEVIDLCGSDEYGNYEDLAHFEWILDHAYALVSNDNGETFKIELDDLEGVGII